MLGWLAVLLGRKAAAGEELHRKLGYGYPVDWLSGMNGSLMQGCLVRLNVANAGIPAVGVGSEVQRLCVPSVFLSGLVFMAVIMRRYWPWVNMYLQASS